jgi:hypothetical protein
MQKWIMASVWMIVSGALLTACGAGVTPVQTKDLVTQNCPPDEESGCGGGGGGGGEEVPSASVAPFPFPPYITKPNLGNMPVQNLIYQCGQPVHLWVAFNAEVSIGTPIYPTGIVVPNSGATFYWVDTSGAVVASHTTQAARANCVIHHEPESMNTSGFRPGLYAVYASYWGIGTSGNGSFGLPIAAVGRFIQLQRFR